MGDYVRREHLSCGSACTMGIYSSNKIMLTKEQLEERKNTLGGSEIAAALGLSRYMTPLELWAIKTGLIEPADVSDKLQVRLGNKLEQIVAELFEEETGENLERVDKAYVHPKYPFLVGHIDRKICGKKAIVEIKTTDPFRIKEFVGNEIPQEYLIQIVYYMALTGVEIGYVACLFGNSDFVIKQIVKDKDLENDIIKKAVTFWTQFVQTKVMPTVTKSDADTLYKLFPSADEGQEIGLGEEANRLADNLQSMGADCKVLIDQMDETKNKLKAFLGEAAIGRTDKYIIRWQNIVTKAFTVPEKRYRKLDVKKIGEKK